jgi:SAM-dependent methyltransferase
MDYKPQVTKEHYVTSSYDTKDRWISYWYQIRKVLECNPKNVLEIGPGNKSVTNALRKAGVEVTAVDIASDLQPDVIASVLELPFAKNSFDVVLCAEVLEHLPFGEFSKALIEIHRISGRFAIVSLPHAGYVFSLEFKIPLLRKIELIWKLPFFWKIHVFNGEHHWELGKRGYPVRRIKQIIVANGFGIRESGLHTDDPAHYFFVLEKQ